MAPVIKSEDPTLGRFDNNLSKRPQAVTYSKVIGSWDWSRKP